MIPDSDASDFYDCNVDRFMDAADVSPPSIPLAPFEVFMTACQYHGVTCNGGWSHGLTHYGNELDVVEFALKEIGATKLLLHIQACRPLIKVCLDDSTTVEDRESALDRIDRFDQDQYSKLGELVELYFRNNYGEIRTIG